MKTGWIILGVVGVAGGGLYLYLRSKKKNETTPSTATGLTGTPGQSSTGTLATTSGTASTNQEITSTVVKQATVNVYADSPIPLPGDMTMAELQNLNDFCKLPDGVMQTYPPSSGLFSHSFPVINNNINSKWGLSNTLKDQSKASQSYPDYFSSLKKYRGC